VKEYFVFSSIGFKKWVRGYEVKENDHYQNELFYISSNIQYYKHMMAISSDPHIRMFYENLLNSEIRQFNESQWYYQQTTNLRNQENETYQSEQREFTLEELAGYDGSGGRPAYVAANGIVYDVSLEATWGGSTHFNLYAGKDLTAQFNGCHQGKLEVLRNLPQVGIIQEQYGR